MHDIVFNLPHSSGVCSGTALGFFWALSGKIPFSSFQDVYAAHTPEAAAEKRELYRFSADLGKLALRIADQYGTSLEKWYVVTILISLCSFFLTQDLHSVVEL